MNAVDTNVFAYAFDADEGIKQPKAEALLTQLAQQPLQTLLLWQVAGEFLNWLRRWESAGRISGSDVEAHFHDVLTIFPLRLPTAAHFAMSFALRSRYSLSHWDSMLLAACQEAGVNVLFTEDLSAGAEYDGVKIVNPFT